VKRILVTGASRGIGRAIAVQLAEKDSRLLLHGRDISELEITADLVKSKGAEAQILVSDLSQPEEVVSLAKSVGSEPLDCLINNAGIAIVKSVEECTLEEWQRTFMVNVTAPFLLIQKLLGVMVPGSSIVNILSIAARTGFAGWSSYCSSKFALEGFSQSLREELLPRKIRVINIYPAATATDIWTEIPGQWKLEQMMPADEVGRAVAHALSAPVDVVIDNISLGNMGGSQ
jgi:NAD(P)-dependent dehydrogenase (short-subunit alcohol dehydrogenase family)